MSFGKKFLVLIRLVCILFFSGYFFEMTCILCCKSGILLFLGTNDLCQQNVDLQVFTVRLPVKLFVDFIFFALAKSFYLFGLIYFIFFVCGSKLCTSLLYKDH